MHALQRLNFHAPWPRPLWDETSRQFFLSQTVRCEATGTCRAKLDRATLLALTGAPRHSRIQAIAGERSVDIVVANDELFEAPYRISICRRGGQRVLRMHSLYLNEHARLHGIGPRMLVLMVKAARRIGIQIVTGQGIHGAYADGGLWSGALAAAKLGWDAELPADYVRAMPDYLSDAETLRELLLHPGGRDWWDRHPIALQLQFDASSNSAGMQFLQRYMRQHQIRVHQ